MYIAIQKFGCVKGKTWENESNSKVMKGMRIVYGRRINVILNDKCLEKVECFKYFRLQVTMDGRIGM